MARCRAASACRRNTPARTSTPPGFPDSPAVHRSSIHALSPGGLDPLRRLPALATGAGSGLAFGPLSSVFGAVTPRQRTINALVSALLEWYSGNARDLPWRRKPRAYAVWISEIMLQQTQVKTVLPYWKRWMRELPTIPSLAAASPEAIHKLWEGLGYTTASATCKRRRTSSWNATPDISRNPSTTFSPSPAWAATPRRHLQHRVQPGQTHPRRQRHPRSHTGVWDRHKPEVEADERATLATGGRAGPPRLGFAGHWPEAAPGIPFWCASVPGKRSHKSGKGGFQTSRVVSRLFILEPIVDGTRRAGVLAPNSAMRTLSGGKALRGLSREPRRGAAQSRAPGQNTGAPLRRVCRRATARSPSWWARIRRTSESMTDR